VTDDEGARQAESIDHRVDVAHESFHDASSGTPDRPWKRRSIVTARTPGN